MPRSPQKPDPYCHFKDDGQRRRALNFRCLCKTVALVAIAMAPQSKTALLAALQWARTLVH